MYIITVTHVCFRTSRFMHNLISHPTIMFQLRKADIRNPLSLLAHERSRFATCQWELLTPTDISIPFTHRLVLYALEAGECLFCVQMLLNNYRYWTHLTSDLSLLRTIFLLKSPYSTSQTFPLSPFTYPLCLFLIVTSTIPFCYSKP